MVTEGQLWEVVGGAETGGIVVREGKLLSSREAKAKLAVGARVRERERDGERLRFVRAAGTGPVTGWVSVSTGGEELLRKCAGEELSPAQAGSVPAAHELTPEQETLLLSKLHSVWHRPGRDVAEEPTPEPVARALAALRLEESLLREPSSRSIVGQVMRVFRNSFDMLELGPTQLPHLHEVILQMASFVLGKLRPLLASRGFADSMAGFVAIQEAIRHHASDEAEVRSVAARVAYMLCFSLGNDPNGSGRTAIAQRIWARMLRGTVPLVATWQSYLDHLALPPLERRRRSGPRTIAFAGALLDTILEGARPQDSEEAQASGARQRVVWIVGARSEVEGRLARAGYFDEAGCFLSGETMSVYLIGDDLQDDLAVHGDLVTVRACGWDDAASGRLPDPQMVVFFHTGLGTLQAETFRAWLPKLVTCLLLPVSPPPSILLTCRCEAEARGELALIKSLGAKVIMPAAKPRHVRNLYSGTAADPEMAYDENGWFIAIRGSSCEKERTSGLARAPESCLQDTLKRMERASGDSDGAVGSPSAGRGKAVFWGILDLKYDSAAPLDARVRVLETGDGRFSRFSGCGAAIKEAVEKDVQLEKALIHRAVMVENKKLTHDLMVDSGYEHTIPRQRAYPREYREDLASSIRRDLDLGADDFCVLKLCNRQRGAGVIPIRVADLQGALKELLQPPADVDLWLREEQACGGAQRLEWGSFEEQLRHWWSNECPCFVVEELCRSQLLEIPRDGEVLRFDGTLRVGFSLHQTQPEAEEGASATQRPAGCTDIYQPLFGSRNLRVHWLGGYWKLPIADAGSPDLRARVISAAKQGTAPVDPAQLHDIYTSLGDLVRALFEDHDLSHEGLQQRYAAFPELSAFVAARLATSLKVSDRSGRLTRLGHARSMIKDVSGHPRNCALSYIERMCGVAEAMQGNWRAAHLFLQKSLEAMPTNATTLQLLGIYQRNMRNDDLAAKLMEHTLLLDPDFKAPYVNLGAVCLRLGDLKRAVSISEAGLVRHPGTAPLQYNLGMATLGLACQQERLFHGCAAELRSKALGLLVAARDGSHVDYPWTDQDKFIVTMLESRDRRLDLARCAPKDGWYFAGWRP